MVKHIFDRFFSFSELPEIRTVEGFSAVVVVIRCEHRLCSQSRRASCCNEGSVCVRTAHLPIAKLPPLLIPRFIRHRRRSETSPTALYPDWILCRGEAACILRRHGYYSTECKELSSKKEGVAAGWDICFLRGFWCVCRCLASLDCGGFENEFRLIYNWGAVYCYVWVCAGGCGDAAAAFNREERNGAAGIGEMCRETRPGGGFGPRTSTPLSCQSGKAVCCKAKAPASGHYLALDSQ